MSKLFGKNDNTVVINRKVFSLKRKLKNPNDKRVKEHGSTVIFYIPITRDQAVKLGLTENDFILAEVAKVPAIPEPLNY